MISGCVYASRNLPSFLVLAVVGNTAATLAVPFLSALFPQSLYFGRIPFRAQTYIDIFVVIGSFLGQCVRIGRFIGYYDKWQHLISGILGVFLGCVLIKAVSPKIELDKRLELCGGVGFSFFLMLIWEVFEFFADYYIPPAQQIRATIIMSITTTYISRFSDSALKTRVSRRFMTPSST